LQVHHGQHHRVYVENVRTLAKQVRLADRPLEHILRQTAGQDGHRTLFNNAAQAWNHAFYWRSLVSAVTGCHLYFAHRVTFLPAELGHTVAAGSVLAVHPEEADGAFTRLWQEDYFLRRISVKKATGQV